jgi:hypothetical protein
VPTTPSMSSDSARATTRPRRFASQSHNRRGIRQMTSYAGGSSFAQAVSRTTAVSSRSSATWSSRTVATVGSYSYGHRWTDLEETWTRNAPKTISQSPSPRPPEPADDPSQGLPLADEIKGGTGGETLEDAMNKGREEQER